MRSKAISLFAVIGAATVLILAANTIAIAAGGHGFLLGQSNSTSKMTTLKRTTSGTALKVTTKSSANAPFAVNGKGKVTNLNADLLDGLDSSTLRSHTYVFNHDVAVASTSANLPVTVPNGTYLFSYWAVLSGTSGNTYCQVLHHHGATTTFLGGSNAASSGGLDGRSGAGLVTMATGDTITLNCGSSSAFTTLTGEGMQMVMTPTVLTSTTSARTTVPSGRSYRGLGR